jgi:hypothetical protein
MPNGSVVFVKKYSPTILLHDLEELDDDLGAWVDENLTLSRLLGVVDGVERIVED